MLAFILGWFFVLHVVGSMLSTNDRLWEGVLLWMVSLVVLLVRGACSASQREETILVCVGEVIPCTRRLTRRNLPTIKRNESTWSILSLMSRTLLDQRSYSSLIPFRAQRSSTRKW
jgi:hypothetical protein